MQPICRTLLACLLLALAGLGGLTLLQLLTPQDHTNTLSTAVFSAQGDPKTAEGVTSNRNALCTLCWLHVLRSLRAKPASAFAFSKCGEIARCVPF